MSITLNQYNNRLQRLKLNLPKIMEGAEMSAIMLLEGKLKTRIFEKGIDSEDHVLGEYSKGWYAWRKKNGRENQRKNLSFSGLLSKSITHGLRNGKMILGIVRNQYAASKLYPYSRGQKDKKGNKKKGIRSYTMKNSYAVKSFPDTIQVSEWLKEQNKDRDIFKPMTSEIELCKKEAQRYMSEKVMAILMGKS